MDNQSRYVSILRESLSKKERILNNLLEITKQQEDYLGCEEFDYDVFEDTMDVKSSMIEELNTVDDGFEVTYERIGEYMRFHQSEMADDIREMQNRIREITRLSAAIQALEERNRQKLERVFGQKRKEVQGYRKGNQVMSNYVQSMSAMSAVRAESMLDQKK